jgi:uncharacterized iron-regulated membrane protein
VAENTRKMQRRFKLRPATRWLHTWGGIILGGVVSVICLTGSVIVFRQEIERARWPQSSTEAGTSHRLSLDSAAEEITRSRPGSSVTRVSFPARPNDPYVFQIKSADKQTHRLAIDASTGRILAEVPQTQWLDWVIDLHRNVLAGKTGRKIVGGIGIVWAALAATGLLLWALGGGKWRAWVVLGSSGGSRRFNFNLHRASGLWALLFIAVLSFTGTYLSYPQTFRDAWELTGQPASVRAPQAANAAKRSTISLDEYVATARTAIPDGAPMELRLQESSKDSYYMRIRRAGDLSQAGSNRVYMDQGSGKVLSIELAVNWPLGVQLFQAFQPIHYGEFGGLPVKILWSFFGAIPAVLFVTGLRIWWRPNKQKPSREPRPRGLLRKDAIAEPVGQ